MKTQNQNDHIFDDKNLFDMFVKCGMISFQETLPKFIADEIDFDFTPDQTLLLGKLYLIGFMNGVGCGDDFSKFQGVLDILKNGSDLPFSVN